MRKKYDSMQNKCLYQLYNFIILRKKRDSNTGVFLWNLWNFHKQWWLLLKTLTYYYIIKNCIEHKLAIFKTVLLLLLLLLLHLLLTQWWDTRLEHDVARLWEERVDSRNVCLKQKEVLLMLYYIDKNWYHFIKEYLE